MPLDDVPADLPDECLRLLGPVVTELADRLDNPVRRINCEVLVLDYWTEYLGNVGDTRERVASPSSLDAFLHREAQLVVAEMFQATVVQRDGLLGEGCPGETRECREPLQVTLLRCLIGQAPPRFRELR